MLKVSLILLFAWNLVCIFQETAVATAQGECSTNSDCHSQYSQFRQVCCKLKYRNSTGTCRPLSCYGLYCFTDGDCGGIRECCVCNTCKNHNSCPRCNTNSECAFGEYCCKQGYFSGKNYISANVCRRSCVGEICFVDKDCSGPAEYCNTEKKCAKSSSAALFPRWAIALLVIGGLGFAVLCGICLYCRCNSVKICRNNIKNTEEHDNTNMCTDLELSDRRIIPPPTTPSSQYNHLDRQTVYETLKSPSENNIDKKSPQTDSDGYELTDPR